MAGEEIGLAANVVEEAKEAAKEIEREEDFVPYAELVAEVTEFTGQITWDTTMPNGQPRRSLDASRAKALFGFEARTTLRDGLERTVAWYREAGRVVAGR